MCEVDVLIRQSSEARKIFFSSYFNSAKTKIHFPTKKDLGR